MTLEIHNFTQNEINNRFFEQILKTVLESVNQEKSDLNLSVDKIEVSLAVVGEGRMRKLNKFYRGKNRVTDVLAFSNFVSKGVKNSQLNAKKKTRLSGKETNKSVIDYLEKAFPRMSVQNKEKNQELKFIEPPDGVQRLGEIVICYPQAKKQAKRINHLLEKELAILFVHGILHLLGYEHEEGGIKAENMKKMEKKVLASIR